MWAALPDTRSQSGAVGRHVQRPAYGENSQVGEDFVFK